MTNAPPPPVWDVQPSAERLVRYAGFWLRFIAAIVDGIAIMILWKVISFFLPEPALPDAPTRPEDVAALIAYMRATMEAVMPPLSLIIYAVLCWAYFVLQETSKAQATLGKRLLGIRVSSEDGTALSVPAASLRTWPMYFANIAALVAPWLNWIVLLLGLIACVAVAFSSRKQGLHDKMAGAILTRR